MIPRIMVKDNWKLLRSSGYNYNFDMTNGIFLRWGNTFEDDPDYSPYGPEIADIEITTVCKGIHTAKGSSCVDYCYKMNSVNGEHMSYETFVKVIEKLNENNQLTQVAFGLGATGEENPDLWKMCEYLRANNIIPNGTVANISDETADRIAKYFGACAVSYHGDFNIFADSVKKLTDRGMNQVNCHLVYYEEIHDELLEVLANIVSDERVSKLNAVVLLALKKKGWAEKNNLTPMSQMRFESLINFCFRNKINVGMDSCSAHKFITFLDTLRDDDKRKSMKVFVEPCESFGIFSSYINVKGEYAFCSFCEGVTKNYNILNCKSFVDDVWNSEEIDSWRQKSLKCGRQCLIFDV